MEESLTVPAQEEPSNAECDQRCQDRRQRRVSIVWRERRSGFDRRRRDDASKATLAYDRMLLALRDRPRLTLGILLVVNALNLADFLLTLRVLNDGGGEANPILRSLFNADPFYAGLFKMIVVFITSYLAWRCRRFRSGLQATIILLAVFTLVICYHIVGLIAWS